VTPRSEPSTRSVQKLQYDRQRHIEEKKKKDRYIRARAFEEKQKLYPRRSWHFHGRGSGECLLVSAGGQDQTLDKCATHEGGQLSYNGRKKSPIGRQRFPPPGQKKYRRVVLGKRKALAKGKTGQVVLREGEKQKDRSAWKKDSSKKRTNASKE